MKPKRKSKTLWFNGLTLAVIVAGALLQYADVIGLSDIAAGRLGLVATLIVAAANFGLRLVTKEAVA